MSKISEQYKTRQIGTFIENCQIIPQNEAPAKTHFRDHWPDSIKKNENFLVSRVRVLLYVIEADEFSYRCLISRNDGPARQSRNESALFPKNIPSNILTFHSEGGVFSTCGFFHMIEEGLKGTPFKFRHKIFTTSGRKKFMKIK